MSTNVPTNHCPYCDSVLDARKEVSGQDIEPTPGDYSICVYCTNFLVYDDNLVLVKIKDDDEMPQEVLDQLTNVKFQIDMRNQAIELGREYQSILQSARMG